MDANQGTNMEKFIVMSQVNLFTDNSDVTPDGSTVIKFISALSNFKLIPTFGHEINQLTGEKTQYLRFTNEKETLVVNFFSQLINITATMSEKSSDMPEKRLTGLIIDVLKKIRPILSNKKFTRFSAIKNIIYKVNKDDSERSANALLKNINNGEALPFEWDYRTAHRLQSKTTNEDLNIVSSVKNATIMVPNFDNGKPFYAIVIELDCNTIFENNSPRFDFSSLDKDKIIPELLDLSTDAIILLGQKAEMV